MSNAHGQDQYMAIANRLAAVERERDEWRDKWAVSAEFNAVHQNRAERAEQVLAALTSDKAVESFMIGYSKCEERYELSFTHRIGVVAGLTAARAAATAREGV